MHSTAHVDEMIHDNVLEVDLHGRLSREDYEDLEPSIERMIHRQGKIRVLVTMHDFEGWDGEAVWEDVKWNARHFGQIERLAIVRNKRSEASDASGAFDRQFRRRPPTWHKWMTGICKTFTQTQVRYFTLDQLDAAHAWINESPDHEPWEPAPPIIPFMP